MVSEVATPSRRAARISRRTVRGRSIGSPPVMLIERTSPAAAWWTRSRSSFSVGSPRTSGPLSTLQWPHFMLQRRVTMRAIDRAGGWVDGRKRSVLKPGRPGPPALLDRGGHPVEGPATEVEDRDAFRQGRQRPDRVAKRSASSQVRVRQERRAGRVPARPARGARAR